VHLIAVVGFNFTDQAFTDGAFTDGAAGASRVVSPCGSCRQLIAEVTTPSVEAGKIVIADIEQQALDAVEPQFRALGAETLAVQTDVGSLESVQRLADRALERFGKVHLVFNNAGVNRTGPLQTMRHEDWQWLIQVNLWGVIHGVEVFVPRLIEQGEGGHVGR